ncbi:MAG TPA: UxaA family hydrolase, partial [Terriglobales bacterium]|nr:UxaA family hydrolase [Terriglobales bacterium]
MFLGYDRHDGSAGIRNHVIILPTVVCANGVAQMVERMVPGTVAVTHNVGCDRLGDGPSHTKVLTNLGCNGNVFAAVVIGLGCEEIDSCRVANLIAATGRPVAHFVVQQCGGSVPTAQKAARAAREFLAAAERMERVPMDDSRLIVGLECGGSDAMSGITANPVMGLVSDRIVAAGGTVILTEIDEMVGTEEVLRRQLVSEELGCQLTELIQDTYHRRSGFFHIYNGRGLSVGTLEGGVTTIQEQSLGCIKKGGSTPILQLLDYGQVPDEHGLVIMDGPGQDTDSMAGLVASGAQMILF